MESDSGKRAKESGVRNRRYSIRYPFAADAEMLELESGNRATGVTSDLSLGGCFVCARCTLEIHARVRGTLKHGNKKVKMLAVVRVVLSKVGMGVEFLDIDPVQCKTAGLDRKSSQTTLKPAVTSGGLYHMTEEVPPRRRPHGRSRCDLSR